MARMKAMVEPLPLVPATWITGGRLLLRMAERREQPLDAIERQIDELGMQRGQPRDDGVDGGHSSVCHLVVPRESGASSDHRLSIVDAWAYWIIRLRG